MVAYDSTQTTIAMGQSANVNSHQVSLNPGSYVLNVFATDSASNVVSPSASYSFSTGTYKLLFDPSNIQYVSLSVNPQPIQINNNYNGYIAYFYQPNTQVTIDVKATDLSSTSQHLLACIWLQGNNGQVLTDGYSCTPGYKSPSDPSAQEQTYTFSLNQNYLARIIYTSTTSYSGYSIYVQASGPGTVNPLSANIGDGTVYPTSATFTFTPGAVSTFFASWKLTTTGATPKVLLSGNVTSSLNSVTFTYQQLQSLISPQQLALVVTFANTPYLDISSAPGITTNPSGKQAYQYGTKVTITASAQQGYCFTGWVVNGVPYSKSSSITLTMTQSYVVYAGGSQCSAVTTSTSSSGGSTTTTSSYIPSSGFTISGLSLLGAGLVLVGLVMRKERL